MKRIHFLIFSLLLFCCLPMFAQNIMVSGTVTDSNSEPLIGVNVLVKGTTNGTITDFDGKFSLSTPPNGTLVFSYIGYKAQEVAVRNRTNVLVTMRVDAQDIDEVIIVGTSVRKSDLTGAVSSVSRKVLEEKPVTNINQALQGRVAGVLVNSGAKPGDDSSIKIRGINTIDGSTDPIYVVDGLVMDNFGGGFNSINLNDVASIEVLKDASATALYGSRAANGVILITTKKGKVGEGKVSYDGWFGVRSFSNTPDKMNSKQLFELRRDAATNAYRALNPNASDADLQNFMQDRVMKPYNTANDKEGGFVFGQYELDAYADPNFKDYDWLDEVTRDGWEQNHSVGFTGGGEKGSYYLSLGYSNREGMIKKLSDKTYSGRINADYNIKSWLKVGTNTSFVRTESEIFDNDNVFDKARGANPMLPIRAGHGKTKDDDPMLVLNYGDFYDQNYFNPLSTLDIDNDRVRNRLISSNFLNINPIKGLNIRTSFSLNYLEESRFRYTPNNIQEAIRYAHNGEAMHKRDQRIVWQWDNSVSYDNTFGDHRINAMLGTSMSKIDRNYTEVTARGFNDNLFGYYNLGASNHLNNRSVGSDFTASSLMSYIARANYTYANKYFLTATARYDGSSKFASGRRWGLFPSFSAAWNVLGENFMDDQEIFDQLKLRVGYGLVGNQEIDDYSFVSRFTPKVTLNQTSYVIDNRKNGIKDTSWESQRQFNAGLDVGVLNGRMRFSTDFFFITNKDLLMTRTIASSTGFNTAVVNIGSIENKGVEFTIDASVIDTRDFQWNLSANISKDKNKVTKLYGMNDYVLKYDDDRNLQKEGNLFIGESRNTIYIWKTGGIAQESDMERLKGIDWSGRTVNPGDLYPLDLSGPDGKPDGKIDENDRVIVGSPDPKFYGGFSTDLTYKGITLNAVFNYSYGAKKLSYLYESMISSTGKGLASVDLLDRWSPENTGAKFPRPILNDPLAGSSYNTFSASQMDHSVQNASFLRLSTLTLAYTLPQNVINTLRLSNLRVYTTASNLFCITPYKGYDPEMGDWYPPTRMFVFGVNLSF